jgi:hypothetical protein
MIPGYKIYVWVWYAAGNMGGSDELAPILGPFASLEEARAEYDSLLSKDFVAQKLIELRPVITYGVS